MCRESQHEIRGKLNAAQSSSQALERPTALLPAWIIKSKRAFPGCCLKGFGFLYLKEVLKAFEERSHRQIPPSSLWPAEQPSPQLLGSFPRDPLPLGACSRPPTSLGHTHYCLSSQLPGLDAGPSKARSSCHGSHLPSFPRADETPSMLVSPSPAKSICHRTPESPCQNANIGMSLPRSHADPAQSAKPQGLHMARKAPHGLP